MAAHIHADPPANAVAFAIELPSGEISTLGWLSIGQYKAACNIAVLSDGCRYVFAYQAESKPRTHTVNGFEVPEPMREAPMRGSEFWSPSPGNPAFAMRWTWKCDDNDYRWLERGLVHATKEAAVANAKAMIKEQP